MWLKIKQWGDPWGAGWMQWPAGMFARVRLARNVYESWSGYTQAKDRTKWLKDPRNAGAKAMVDEVKEVRRERPVGKMERWEEWVNQYSVGQ